MKRIILIHFFVIVCIFCFLGIGLEGAVIKAGPAGDYATIQEAIDKAVAIGGNNEVRVQTGTYLENLLVPDTMVSGSMVISGGWNGTFNMQNCDPAVTVVDGNSRSRVLLIIHSGGTVQVSMLTFTGGSLPTPSGSRLGSGICVALSYNDAAAVISECHIVRNKIDDARALGGGIFVGLIGETRASISKCVIMENAIYGTDEALGAGIVTNQWDKSRVEICDNIIKENYGKSWTSAQGGGIWIECYEESTFKINGNYILENEINTPQGGECLGGGIFLRSSYKISGELVDNRIQSNRATGRGETRGTGGYFLAARHCGCSAPDVSLTARRNFWLDNKDDREYRHTEQLYLFAEGTSALTFTDSVIAGGDVRGALTEAEDKSVIRLTNLTVTDYYDWGLWLSASPTAALSLYNSIAYGTGTDLILTGAVDMGSNLVNVDPRFVNPPARDYSLLSTSPAINAGDNTPPGGLSSMDIIRGARVINGTVDIGAYEFK